MDSGNQDDGLLMEVHSPVGEHCFKVFESGFVEGFPAGAVVINHALTRQQRRAGLLRQLVLDGRITGQEAASLL